MQDVRRCDHATALTTLLAGIGDQTFDFIVCPYNDLTTLNALQAFLNDSTGRWSYAQQTYGHVFSSKQGTLSALVTFGDARNNQHETVCMGANGSPTPTVHLGLAVSGGAGSAPRACASTRHGPCRPLTLVQGVIAPPLVDAAS